MLPNRATHHKCEMCEVVVIWSSNLNRCKHCYTVSEAWPAAKEDTMEKIRKIGTDYWLEAASSQKNPKYI